MNVSTRNEWIDLQVSDGSVLRAFTCRPANVESAPVESAPGLLVLQEIFGVNTHIQDVCRRFAEQGFVAVAPDLFHRTAPGFVTPYDNYLPGRTEAMKMTIPGIEADFRAVSDWFATDAHTKDRAFGSIGFCMGGRMSFLAATTLPLACAVSFYGGNIPQHLDRVEQLNCPLMLIWGGHDSSIPAEQRRALEDGLRHASKGYLAICFEDAGHGFFCDQRDSYSAETAALAWPMALDFLRKYLDPDARQ